MEGRRKERVAELIRQQLGQMLVKDVRDPSLREVTFTEVRVSPDLSVAQVFFAAHDDTGAEQARRGLERAAPFFRRELSRLLKLRRTPELRFRRDEVLDQGEHIDTILRELGQVGDES